MNIKGEKLKMTQIFQENRAIGATPIKCSGDEIAHFKPGDVVAVSGITKGKGFQGVVKRHGFHGGPKKNRHRAPGSIGNTSPQRVIPGRRMAGRMGGVRRTIKNLEIILVNPEEKIMHLKGAIPGVIRGKVVITKHD